MRSGGRFTRGRAGAGVAAVLAGAAATLIAGETGPAMPAPARCRAVSLVTGEEPTRRDCCFTNPAYGGVCVVEPAGEETCASILAYLNNEQSTGRSYCRRTNIRGGWRQVQCEGQAPTGVEAIPR